VTRRAAVKKDLKQMVGEELWMNYFNDYLFQHQVISETERNKMRNLIGQRMHTKQKDMK